MHLMVVFVLFCIHKNKRKNETAYVSYPEKVFWHRELHRTMPFTVLGRSRYQRGHVPVTVARFPLLYPFFHLVDQGIVRCRI